MSSAPPEFTRRSPPAAADQLPPAGDGLWVQHVSVLRGTATIVDSASCHVPPGGTLVLVGESGCGKTTLLKAIAGLIPSREGRIRLNGLELTTLPPEQRRVLYLDQEPLLFEHLTVLDNAAFAVRMQGLTERIARETALPVLDAVGMSAHRDKWPHQLSGGQKQRTAFARAVLARPRTLLLDEPFSALDATSRTSMQQLFLQLTAEFQLTSILVTHDIREALAAGSAFCRMEHGRLRQYADKAAFVDDAANGVREELEFWQSELGKLNEAHR